MQQLLVFIHYNGEWTDSFTFQNFQVTGIQIPTDCTYQNLINSISDRLKVQNEENEVQINYQVKQQYPRLAIEDDSSLHFYIQLKNTEADQTKFPLCITIKKEKDNNFFNFTPTTTVLQSEQQSTSTKNTETASDIIVYAKTIGKQNNNSEQ